MCFSATASFTAGTVLSAIGAVTLTKTERRSEVPFAIVPLLFGVQQLIEGIVWLTFSTDAPQLAKGATYVYSVFSHVLWPIYIPFAFWALEAKPWRRSAMVCFQMIGLAVGLYLLYFIVTRPVVAEIVGMHIAYQSPHFFIKPVIVLYVAATCFTGFFSSHAFVKLFGVCTLLSFIGTYAFYAHALVSVWCFFAAILSVLIFLHLRFRKLGGFPLAEPGPPRTTDAVVLPRL